MKIVWDKMHLGRLCLSSWQYRWCQLNPPSRIDFVEKDFPNAALLCFDFSVKLDVLDMNDKDLADLGRF
jgi:hypothetical protein